MKKFTKIIIATCLVAASSLTHADAILYWSEVGPQPGPGRAGPAYIKSGTNLPGGVVSAVVSGASKVKGPNGVEIIDGRVWWPDQQLGKIQSVLPDGSDLKSYDATPSYNPYDLDVSGNNLYWTQNSSGAINVIDMAAATPVSSVLVSGLNSPFAIDVVGNFIYWSEALLSG